MPPTKEARDKWRRRNPNYQKEWRAKNREVLGAKKRAYAAAHRAEGLENELRRRYGLTTAGYTQMASEQGGRCACCGAVPSLGPGKKLVVDHDHVSNRVRGLLCATCNAGIGFFHNDPLKLEQAAMYLRRTKGDSK